MSNVQKLNKMSELKKAVNVDLAEIKKEYFNQIETGKDRAKVIEELLQDKFKNGEVYNNYINSVYYRINNVKSKGAKGIDNTFERFLDLLADYIIKSKYDDELHKQEVEEGQDVSANKKWGIIDKRNTMINPKKEEYIELGNDLDSNKWIVDDENRKYQDNLKLSRKQKRKYHPDNLHIVHDEHIEKYGKDLEQIKKELDKLDKQLGKRMSEDKKKELENQFKRQYEHRLKMFQNKFLEQNQDILSLSNDDLLRYLNSREFKLEPNFRQYLIVNNVPVSASQAWQKLNQMRNQLSSDLKEAREELRKPIRHARNAGKLPEDDTEKDIDDTIDLSDSDHVLVLIRPIREGSTYIVPYVELDEKYRQQNARDYLAVLDDFDKLVDDTELLPIERDVLEVILNKKGLEINERFIMKRVIAYIKKKHKQKKTNQNIYRMLDTIAKKLAKQNQKNELIWYYSKYKPGEMIKCRKCPKILPPDSLFFAPDKRKRNGFKSICRKCEMEYQKKYYNNIQKVKSQYFLH